MRLGMLKFNLLLWAAFSALFGSIMAVISAPLWIGYASAAVLVWGYDIVAGVAARRIDRDWREEEIRIQTIALAAERRRQEEESAALLRSYLSDRRAAE